MAIASSTATLSIPIRLDPTAEPVVLTVPEIDANRYYSIQFTDAYTFNSAYAGSATRGNDAARFLVAGPRLARSAGCPTVSKTTSKTNQEETENECTDQ